MDARQLEARMRKLERQLSATCFRFNSKPTAKLLRRCRAIGQALVDTFNEDYYRE
jgi:hypothetical protein